MDAEKKYNISNGNHGISGQNDLLQQEQYFHSSHSPPQPLPSAPPHDHQHPSDHDQRINVPDAYCAYANATPTASNPAPPNYVKLETALPTVVVDNEHPQEPTHQLPCCGIGIGWSLFLLGFIFPFLWIGGGLLWCTKYDLRLVHRREKPGYIACFVMGVILMSYLIIRLVLAVYVYVYFNPSEEHYV